MGPLLLGSSIALVGLCAGACGGKGEHTSRTAHSTAASGSADTATAARLQRAGSYIRGDGDADETDHRDQDDRIRGYGHAAGAADKRAIAALVERYFAAAAAGDGPRACSLIYAGLANSSNLGEVAEAAHPPAPGVASLRGESCGQIMSLLFAENRRALIADAATVKILSVRVYGNHGVALLGFKTAPEGKIPLRRESETWKIDSLLEEELI